MTYPDKTQRWTPTSVISMERGRMSGLDRFDTMLSSSTALHTMKTMKPRLSMSRARDFVSGRVGEPAITTTSVRPPFLAFFALRTFLAEQLF